MLHVRLLDAGRTVFKGGGGRFSGGAKSTDAAAGSVMAADVIDGGKEHAFHGGLAIDVAGDLSHAAEIIDSILFVSERRHDCRGADGGASAIAGRLSERRH